MQKILTDEQITSLAFDCNALPECVTDKTLALFAMAIEQVVLQSPAIKQALEDSKRLDFIASEYLHITPFNINHTDDADAGWMLQEEHMGAKGLVTLHTQYSDHLRTAIDAVRKDSND